MLFSDFQSEMHPVYSDSGFIRLVVHVWWKKFTQSPESVVEKKWLPCGFDERCKDRSS